MTKRIIIFVLISMGLGLLARCLHVMGEQDRTIETLLDAIQKETKTRAVRRLDDQYAGFSYPDPPPFSFSQVPNGEQSW